MTEPPADPARRAAAGRSADAAMPPLALGAFTVGAPPLATGARPPVQTPDDQALTLSDTSLLVEDALPDWDGDPVIADFMDALLRLELDQAAAAPGATTPEDEEDTHPQRGGFRLR